MLFATLISLSFFVTAQASCDNACSGHGSCTANSICQCYDNWGLGLSHDSGDCSQRICPFEFAWVDTPDKLGNHHKYAECAAKGICNRDSGECECFPGYEGKACQRTACPNDCSGHGQCAYIEDLPYQNTYFQYRNNVKDITDPLDPTNNDPKLGLDNFLNQDAVELPYYYWDKRKTRGCICDPEYGDVDCSKRMCAYGTDVMDLRNDLTQPEKYQVQSIRLQADQSSYASIDYTSAADFGVSAPITNLAGQTFALTFKSKLNESFTTIPIVFNAKVDKIHLMAIQTKLALQSLPNNVIDRVLVTAEVEFTVSATVKVASGQLPAATDDTVGFVHINVTFVGENVQGPQNLLTVKADKCGNGCTPKLTGLETRAGFETVSEAISSDFNSFECGRRGKCDYSSGLCQCFAGYTGLSCGTITALV